MSNSNTLMAVKKVEGTLYRIFEPSKRGRYRVTDFIVKTQDGTDLKCSSFKAVDSQLLGKTVGFEATVNSYNGKESLTVTRDSELSVLGGSESKSVAQVQRETSQQEQVTVSDGITAKDAPARRGRPRRNEASSAPAVAVSTQTTPISTSNPVVADLEAVREASHAIFLNDLQFIQDLVPKECIGSALQALQAIRATVFIESNKRDRVADMHPKRY